MKNREVPEYPHGNMVYFPIIFPGFYGYIKAISIYVISLWYLKDAFYLLVPVNISIFTKPNIIFF